MVPASERPQSESLHQLPLNQPARNSTPPASDIIRNDAALEELPKIAPVDETPQNELKYRELADGEMRLVSLLPASSFDDPINCTLHYATLQDPPPYEALSYTWGDAKITKPINLEHTHFEVTLNLEAALRHLRQPDAARMLWADAICIDQSNYSERNVQVWRMGEIYDRPQCVLVWLGPEVDGSSSAIEKLVETSRLAPLLSQSSAGSIIPSFWGPEGLNGPPADIRVWEPIRELFNRPWWFRTWTLQEATVSTAVIFVCGSATMTLNTLEEALRVVLPLWSIASSVAASKSYSGDPDLLLFLSTRVDSPFLLSQYKAARSSGEARSPDKSFFSNLLRDFRFKDATDPRDKGYGILNLALLRPELDYLLKPDYTSTVECVYIRSAKYIILEQGNLEVFQDCTYRHALDLPSWVPPWNSCENTAFPIRKWAGLVAGTGSYRDRFFHTDSGKSMDIRFDDDDKILVVKGINFDKVSTLGTICLKSEGFNTYEVVREWNALATRSRNIYQSPDRKERAFACTIRDDIRYDGSVRSKGGRSYSAESFRDDDDDYRMFAVMELMYLENRRFAITDADHFALVPSKTQVGDIVCVIYGCEVPCILRPKPGDVGRYWLVGECYVHEHMDGQVVVNLEKGLVKEDTFRLI
jgi:hypothetical protein